MEMPTESASGGPNEDSHPKKTGAFWTASAHISSAMVGTLLWVAWDIAHLGWYAGPAAICLISSACYYTSRLLCDCYPTASGDRKFTYGEAVEEILGGVKAKACAFIQYLTLFGMAIEITVTASMCMMAIKHMNCFRKSNREKDCNILSNPYAIIFGITEILLSQIPDLDGIGWVSIVSVVMFFTNALIGLGLAIAQVAAGGSDESNEAETKTQKIWMSFRALGDIASAYSFAEILVEIQATIGLASDDAKTIMKSASLLSTVVMTTLFMLWGCVGYAALGDYTPRDLTEFTFYGPSWLLYMANAASLINLVGRYQIFSQPIFAFVEKQAASGWSCTKEREIPLPGLGQMNLFRLVWRTVFVILTTVISMAFPLFNDVVDIITLGFWPLAVYFPVEMYIKQEITDSPQLKWKKIGLKMLSMACLAISIMATMGSMAGLMYDLKDYGPFRMSYI